VSRLLIWRHGETSWNASGRVQGHADIDLSDVGREQAATAATRLAALGPTTIVSSDLRRAHDTASVLAAVTGLPVSTDPRLKERFYGPWQGLTMGEIAERWPEEQARWRAGESSIGLGIESLDDLAKRAVAAFTDAVSAATGGLVVVVTHGGTARQGCAAMLGWSDSAMRTLCGLANCHWTELRFDPARGWRLWSHNTL